MTKLIVMLKIVVSGGEWGGISAWPKLSGLKTIWKAPLKTASMTSNSRKIWRIRVPGEPAYYYADTSAKTCCETMRARDEREEADTFLITDPNADKRSKGLLSNSNPFISALLKSHTTGT